MANVTGDNLACWLDFCGNIYRVCGYLYELCFLEESRERSVYKVIMLACARAIRYVMNTY